jgi:predicted acetyltransferase
MDLKELKLIEPCCEYKKKFMDMLSEFQNYGGPIPFVMHFNKTVFDEILQAMSNNSIGIDVEKDMEPSTTWWLINKDNDLLGIVNIRHRLNDYLTYYGGHIGYGIRPSERNKGYATQLLSLALKKCVALGLKRVLIICHKENIASEKVILKNGGVYEDERIYKEICIHRYWIHVS